MNELIYLLLMRFMLFEGVDNNKYIFNVKFYDEVKALKLSFIKNNT